MKRYTYCKLRESYIDKKLQIEQIRGEIHRQRTINWGRREIMERYTLQVGEEKHRERAAKRANWEKIKQLQIE